MSTLRVTASELNLREGPSTSHAVVRKLERGSLVSALTAPHADGWRRVRAVVGGLPVDGWAASRYLEPARPAARPRWRTAAALLQLLRQVNEMAPHRAKGHDGTVGDAAHASRASDHNPDADGVVRALDVTHDPAHGCDCAALVAALVASRDARVSYLIWDRRIWRSYPRAARNGRPAVPAWEPAPYTGSNPHTRHVHVSVVSDPALYDDVRPWNLTAPPASARAA